VTDPDQPMNNENFKLPQHQNVEKESKLESEFFNAAPKTTHQNIYAQFDNNMAFDFTTVGLANFYYIH
jgi:hypothetical protein